MQEVLPEGIEIAEGEFDFDISQLNCDEFIDETEKDLVEKRIASQQKECKSSILSKNS